MGTAGKSRRKRRTRKTEVTLASIAATCRERWEIFQARRHWDVLAGEHARRSAPKAATTRRTHETVQPRATETPFGTSVVAAATLVLFALSLAVTFPPVRHEEPKEEQLVETVNWALPRHSDTVSRRVALSYVLASRGFAVSDVREITRLLEPYRNPRLLRPGTSLRFSEADGGAPDRIRLELSPDSVLTFVRSENAWSTRVETVPFVMDTVRISGVIESSLWSSTLGGDLDRFSQEDFEDLVYDLADVFAWKVDFTRDLRRGDTFRIALERKVRPDGTVRSRHFLAIELRNGDRTFRAIPEVTASGGYTYYDEDGRSLRGAFSRYPVPYRITSHFTTRRFHPILRRWRAHEGIDYGAPYGAPVEATASGVVTRAGFAGAYGRLVELRHPGGILTRYAHLSSIPPAVHPGARVDQGAVIGRVGASGLATGPHLHYEFLLHGHHKDPLTVRIPGAPSVPDANLMAFRADRDRALALLEPAPKAQETRLVLGSRPAPNAAPPRSN